MSMDLDTPLGPIGDSIIFENDTVRVWSLELEPGGRQPWHRHDDPYLIVPLTDGTNEMRFADGRVRDTIEREGAVMWREPGIPHELHNRGPAPYRNVLIEFKAAKRKA